MPAQEIIELPERHVGFAEIQMLADITHIPLGSWHPIVMQVNHRPNLIVIVADVASSDELDNVDYRVIFELGKGICKLPQGTTDRFGLEILISQSPYYPMMVEKMQEAVKSVVNGYDEGHFGVLHDWQIFDSPIQW